MKYFILLFVLHISFACLTGGTVYSQPSITWQKVYNGFYSYYNYALSVCNADNNNFYIGGHIDDTSSRFNYLMKINQWSDTIWTKKLCVMGAREINAMEMTLDSGVIITGGADSIYTMKLDKNGNILWLKYYNGQGPYTTIIKCLNDGNFISCGFLRNTYSYLIKINNQGEQIWQRFYSNSGGLWLLSLDTDNYGNYILAGGCGNGQSIVKKVDTAGTTLSDEYYSISQACSINYINKSNNYLLISGNYIDTTAFTQDKNRPFIAKIDFNLKLYYLKLFHSTKKESIVSQNIINTNRFVFTLNPSTQIDTFYTKLMITDSMGNVLHEKLIYDPNNLNHYSWLSAEQPVRNGDILFVGDTYMHSYDNVYAIRTDSLLNFPNYYIQIKRNNNIIPKEYKLYQNYPNPFNPTTKIKFEIPILPLTKGEAEGVNHVTLIIYDILGREVAKLVNDKLQPGSYEVEWNGSNFASGVYFYKLSVSDPETSSGLYFTETKKMVLMK